MIIDFLFPKRCVGCLSSDDYLCSSCIKRITPAIQTCPTCTKPSVDGMTHSKCLRPLSLNGLFSLWKYKGPIRKAILVLKYKYAYGMGEVLADKAAERLVKSKILNGKDGSSLLPIPIHKRRKNNRGFNQTEVVGKLIAEKMLWQYRGKMLIKTRYTVPQTGLERTIRLRNQRNSYKVIGLNGIDKKQTVFLFDDICTTGATIKEAAKTLKRKGFTNVWGLTIAKT